MILTTPKSSDDINHAIKEWHLSKVVVVGCGSCAAQCGTGGTEGVKKIVQNLQENQIEVLASIVIEEPCDSRLVKKEIRHIHEANDKAEGYIVAACGSGVQTIAEITGKPTITTTDTVMISQTEKIGVYHEKCRACGTCWLNETGGICPITACAKSLLNGPCGGVIDGKCEVGGYIKACGWVAIYNRLKSLDRLDLFLKIRPPRDWSLLETRKSTNVRNEMKKYYVDK